MRISGRLGPGVFPPLFFFLTGKTVQLLTLRQTWPSACWHGLPLRPAPARWTAADAGPRSTASLKATIAQLQRQRWSRGGRLKLRSCDSLQKKEKKGSVWPTAAGGVRLQSSFVFKELCVEKVWLLPFYHTNTHLGGESTCLPAEGGTTQIHSVGIIAVSNSHRQIHLIPHPIRMLFCSHGHPTASRGMKTREDRKWLLTLEVIWRGNDKRAIVFMCCCFLRSGPSSEGSLYSDRTVLWGGNTNRLSDLGKL